MKITLSKYAGFCGGVDRAYAMVKKIAENPEAPKPVFVLGSLVHNNDVVKSIEKMGVKKISVDKDIYKTLDRMREKIGTLIITAHGMGPEIYSFARSRKINLVDTTCPRVIRAQRLAKIYADKNSQIVIIGERNHKEVKGIFEWAGKKAIFVQKENDLKKMKLNPKKGTAIISQTTQNQDFVKRSQDFIRKKYKKAEIMDTICLTTQNRQDEVRAKAAKNDAVVVIGSPESSNSNRLFEIAKDINPKSYFIEKVSQIKKSWFDPKSTKKVWVTAGASTPGWIIEDVMKKLEEI